MVSSQPSCLPPASGVMPLPGRTVQPAFSSAERVLAGVYEALLPVPPHAPRRPASATSDASRRTRPAGTAVCVETSCARARNVDFRFAPASTLDVTT